MSCKFLSDEGADHLSEDPEHRPLRLLMIRFHNGFNAPIYVTSAPAFSIKTALGRTINLWHYDVHDGKITLKGVGSDSVLCLKPDGGEYAHESVTDWPLEAMT